MGPAIKDTYIMGLKRVRYVCGSIGFCLNGMRCELRRRWMKGSGIELYWYHLLGCVCFSILYGRYLKGRRRIIGGLSKLGNRRGCKVGRAVLPCSMKLMGEPLMPRVA